MKFIMLDVVEDAPVSLLPNVPTEIEKDAPCF
jgi:hypothetical protein